MNKTLNILHVEDNPYDRELVKDALEKEKDNFRIIEAATQKEFESLLKKGKYDAVLSDFDILGYEGLQVLKVVKATDPDLPVVIVTGTGSEEIAVQAMKNGAADFVIKSPTHIRRLPQTILAVLEKRRLDEEHKQAQMEIIRAKEEWEQTFDAVPDLIAIIDTNHKIIRANKAMANRLGITPNECEGKICYQAVHGTNEPPPFCPHKQLLEDGKEHVTEVKEKKLGGDFIVSTSPLFDQEGNLYGSVHVARDITKRKLTEEALKLSEEKYRNLIEQSNDAIYLLYKNKFEIINRRFTELFGYSIKETNAPDFNFRELVAPKSIPMIEDRMQKLVKGEKLDPIYEFTGLTKSGKEIECEASVSYIKYKEGQAVQGIIRDITARKLAEETIKRSLKEKEVLLKEIHHRVKNNLQVICSLLSLQRQGADNKKIREEFTAIHNRIYSMSLIHEKLYQSKDLARLDFSEYTRDLVTNLVHVYKIQNVIYKLEIDVKELIIKIDDAVPCGLLLNEIISNALKHAFPDGRKGKIKVSLNSKQKKCELIISDNGIGLPKDLDIDKPCTLGLRLINTLVAQVNGEMKVSRKNGTTFKITFVV